MAQRHLDWLATQRNRKRPGRAAPAATSPLDSRQVAQAPEPAAAPKAVEIQVVAQIPEVKPKLIDREKEKAEKMAEAARQREADIEQWKRCQEMYQNDKLPLIQRLQAACAAHIWQTDLEGLDPARDSEGSDMIGDLLAAEICRGVDGGFYRKMFHGWADEQWGHPLADKIRSTMMPASDTPELAALAKSEWARAQNRSLPPEERAFAIIQRMATASARGEPERALETHAEQLATVMATLTGQSREQLDLQLATFLIKEKEAPAGEALALRGTLFRAKAKEVRAALRSFTSGAQQDQTQMRTGQDPNASSL